MAHRSKSIFRRARGFAVVIASTVAMSLSGTGVAMTDGLEYTRLPLIKDYYNGAPALPSQVQTFIDKVVAGMARGDFDANVGVTPTADYGDMSAKAWLLSHVSAAFRCDRDFGGICSVDQQKIGDPLRFFARRFASQDVEELAEFTPGKVPAEVSYYVEPVSFDLKGIEGLFLHGNDDGEFCSADLAVEEYDVLEAVLVKFYGLLGSKFRLVGIPGVWNVRAAPNLSSATIGRVSYEAVVLPNPVEEKTVETLSDGTVLNWRQVNLHNGKLGYLAAPIDKLVLDNVAEGICLRQEDDTVSIVAHIGGGD